MSREDPLEIERLGIELDIPTAPEEAPPFRANALTKHRTPVGEERSNAEELLRRREDIRDPHDDPPAEMRDIHGGEKERLRGEEAWNTHEEALHLPPIGMEQNPIHRAQNLLHILRHHREADAGGVADVHLLLSYPMHLFAGSSHPALARALAKELDIDPGVIALKTFSGGERYARFLESVRGKDVYLLQTGTRSVNEDLLELFLMCQAAKLSFAQTVHAVIPHFPYARQDRVSEPREPISAKLIAHLLEESGADHVITLDLHSDQIQGFFSIPVDALDARPAFAAYFKGKKLIDPVVVSPDAGGAKRAKKFADMLGADLAIMHKSRPHHQKAEIIEVVGDITGRSCILFDDMIDTGGSLLSAKKALLKRGAHPAVYAAATHAIFSGKAIENLSQAKFKEVIVTDSLPVKAHAFPSLRVLPIAPLLAEVIRHIERGESVTDIYKK